MSKENNKNNKNASVEAENISTVDDKKIKLDETEDIYTINTGAANRLHYKNEPTIILDAEDNLEMLDKPVKEKLSVWKKREGAKLKDMHGMDKVKYIFAYYYQWMIACAIIIFVIYVGINISYRMSFNNRLNVIVFNDAQSNVEAYLNEVVPEYMEFGKKDKIMVNSTVNLKEGVSQIPAEMTTESSTEATQEGSTESTGAISIGQTQIVTNMKLMSMSLANAIDIMIGEEDSFTEYAVEAGLVLDITEYFPEGLYEVVADDLVYCEDPDGENVAAAIKIPEDFARKLDLDYEPYASISCSTKNVNECINFIRLMYGLDYEPLSEADED